MKTKFNEAASSGFVKAIGAVIVAVALLPVVCLGEWKDGIYYDSQGKPYNGEYKNKDWNEYLGDHYSTVNMKNGKMHGEYKLVGDGGRLIEAGNYVDGKKQGEWKYFDDNGKVTNISSYKDGALQGKTKSFYDNGNVKCVSSYIGGKMQGVTKCFDKSGKLRHGEFKERSGFAGEDETVSNYKDGVLHGERITISGGYEEGMKSVSIYKNGILQESKQYDASGKLQFETKYKDGKQTEMKEYDADGELIHSQKY